MASALTFPNISIKPASTMSSAIQKKANPAPISYPTNYNPLSSLKLPGLTGSTSKPAAPTGGYTFPDSSKQTTNFGSLNMNQVGNQGTVSNMSKLTASSGKMPAAVAPMKGLNLNVNTPKPQNNNTVSNTPYEVKNFQDNYNSFQGTQEQTNSNKTIPRYEEPVFNQATKNLSEQGQAPNVNAQTAIDNLNASISKNDIYAQRAKEITDAAGQRISDIGGQGARGAAGYLTTGTSPVGEGNAAILAQTTAAQQRAVAEGANMQLSGNAQGLTAQGQTQSGFNAAGSLGNTAQGNQITAASSAGNLTHPVAGASYFGSPESGNVVGSSQGGTGNSLIDTSISNALNTISKGGSADDAMAQLVGGDVAKTAFIKKMQEFDPGWTPTSSNAIAAQNMQQGQTFQQQATQLDTGLKQLDIITPTAIDFLNKTGLNKTDNPFWNKSINQYISSVQNPADAKVANALMGDIKKYTAQILGATGEINPTRIGEINDTFDPSLLNAQQLTTFLEDLKRLGTNQLFVLQGQSQKSYGGTNSGYQGEKAIPNTSLISSPNSKSIPGSNVKNPVIQGLVGGAINSSGKVLDFVSGLANKILK